MSQDLFIQDTVFMQDTTGNKKISDQEINNEILLSNISIEKIRVNAANKIRMLKEQLNQIILLEDPKQLQYFIATIPELVNQELPLKLQKLEEDLLKLRLKYKDKDRAIILLEDEKESLNKLLKANAIGKIKAQIIATEAILNSSIRPEGVILDYKKLMREAKRDEATLIELENQFNLVKLEEARYEDPLGINN